MRNIIIVMASALIAGAAYAQPSAFVSDENTVALWNFDEGEGPITRDAGPIGIHLRYNERGDRKPDETPPKWVRGKFGKALLFNGDLRQTLWNAADSFKKFFGLKDAITFEAWVKPEDPPAPKNMGFFQNMEYSKNGFRINFSAGFNVGWQLQDGKGEVVINSKKGLPPGVWSHFACTYDGTVMRIYINGVLDTEKPINGCIIQSRSDGISIAYTGGYPFFYGAIDSIRISKIARTEFKVE
ncbi:MAG: LamG domain-containing protein [Spirochaetota bacterium]